MEFFMYNKVVENWIFLDKVVFFGKKVNFLYIRLVDFNWKEVINS